MPRILNGDEPNKCLDDKVNSNDSEPGLSENAILQMHFASLLKLPMHGCLGLWLFQAGLLEEPKLCNLVAEYLINCRIQAHNLYNLNENNMF